MQNITIFAVAILLIGIITSRGIFVDESNAIRALENQGFSQVEIIDSAWFIVGLRGCGDRDAARFTARAVNPAGKNIETYVCTGWPFKGSTIRTM